ncbi:hypothetical protein UXN60_03915 [Enterobacter roggenkampii]|uniref:hypothetical protein n=1 Tax=Enterobacter roggenkampii TaxID=1812935 RepID=UPI002FD3B84A
MIGAKLVSSLMGQANQSGEKSTVVHTLIWLIGVVFVVEVVLVMAHAPTWMLAIILALAILGCIFFGYVYLFCLKKDPDLLRSERMVLQKMAIEKRVYGDDITGERTTLRQVDEFSNNENSGLLVSQVDSAEDK